MSTEPSDPIAAAAAAVALASIDELVNAAAAEAAPAAAAAAPVAPPALDPAAVAALLRKQFPALFGGQPKPIKLHIQADIQARAPGLLSKRSLSAFLHRHTGSTSYLMALSRAVHRFDLDGQPAGELTAEHREVAAQELARRRALQDERRALERQQQDSEREQHQLLGQQRFNRAGLLRDFETTTLTRANFCVLKQVADEALDELLEMARRERAEAPPVAPMPAPREPQRRPQDERRPPRHSQGPQDRKVDRPSDRPSDRPPGRPPSRPRTR